MIKFKPEDFGTGNDREKESAAFYANLKLQKLIDESIVVYGQGIGAMKSSDWCMNGPDFERYRHTHKAILINIEEIKPEPCKHEPVRNLSYERTWDKNWSCKHCGIGLQATWKEIK